ncbi:helix-turn-helix domain-containing protein [Psychrobacillus sp. FSL K6-1464]|uniref:helix-turn-helix domain-containing protein n=1 Tax=Psychrobacillus sp. FSL K6-1464 TaxID=2921545 RepID=UPI0030F9E1CD
MEESKYLEIHKEKMIAFGQMIKEKRNELGVSLDNVAKETGIGKAYLSRIERGDRGNPSFIIVYELCRYFNIDMSNILSNPAA